MTRGLVPETALEKLETMRDSVQRRAPRPEPQL
jgi:hypothetical protein